LEVNVISEEKFDEFRFHPQRNWKINNVDLERNLTNKVSSSKELEGAVSAVKGVGGRG